MITTLSPLQAIVMVGVSTPENLWQCWDSYVHDDYQKMHGMRELIKNNEN